MFLCLLKINFKISGSPSHHTPLLLVGNHISYLDIALLMKACPDFSFVAKHEISRWPVFGPGAKAAQTIFVKRENNSSRIAVREAIGQAFKNNRRVVIFPSGTTCMNESKPWKKGAFEIAKDHQVLIQPFRISYTPLRTVAYIDKDFFPFHLYQVACNPNIQAHIEFHSPVAVNNPVEDCADWSRWAAKDI